jgi:hypothetical protein
MFSDLRDYISLLFSWRWPRIQGEITGVRILGGSGLRLDYRFSLGNELYTGESGCPSWFAGAAIDVGGGFRSGQPVTVRYRRDNPSVNKLDRSVWEDLQGL